MLQFRGNPKLSSLGGSGGWVRAVGSSGLEVAGAPPPPTLPTSQVSSYPLTGRQAFLCGNSTTQWREGPWPPSPPHGCCPPSWAHPTDRPSRDRVSFSVAVPGLSAPQPDGRDRPCGVFWELSTCGGPALWRSIPERPSPGLVERHRGQTDRGCLRPPRPPSHWGPFSHPTHLMGFQAVPQP